METVIAVVALMFLLFVAVGTYATVKAVGAAKRGVDRTIRQARRTVEDSALRAKSYTQPGSLGELAQLRLRLRTTMRATQDALQAKVAQDESLKESLGLFQRLSVHGHELDGELKRLESEPDRAALTTRMPELRARTRRITESADALRWAARDRAHRFAGDELDDLSQQIDMEAGALRHWTDDDVRPPHQAPRSGSAAGGSAADGSSAAGGRTGREGRREEAAGESAARWPEPPSTDSADTEQTWPDPASAPGTAPRDGTRPAISPMPPPTSHSWQKQSRPENTT